MCSLMFLAERAHSAAWSDCFPYLPLPCETVTWGSKRIKGQNLLKHNEKRQPVSSQKGVTGLSGIGALSVGVEEVGFSSLAIILGSQLGREQAAHGRHFK